MKHSHILLHYTMHFVYYVSLYANALWVVQYKNFLNFHFSEPLVGYE